MTITKSSGSNAPIFGELYDCVNNVAMLIVRTSVLPQERTVHRPRLPRFYSALESIKLMKLAMLRIRRDMRLIMKEITYSSAKEKKRTGIEPCQEYRAC